MAHRDIPLTVGYLSRRLTAGMAVDTVLAAGILTTYFTLVFDLTQDKLIHLLLGLAALVPVLMATYGGVVFLTHLPLVRLLRRYRGVFALPDGMLPADPETRGIVDRAWRSAARAPLQVGLLGLFFWIVGALVLSGSLYTKGHITGDEALLVIWGGLLAGLATNTYNLFRVRRLAGDVMRTLLRHVEEEHRPDPAPGFSLRGRFAVSVIPLIVFALLFGSMVTAAQLVRSLKRGEEHVLSLSPGATAADERHSQLQATVTMYLGPLSMVLIFSIGLSALLALGASRDVAQPIHELAEVADAIAAGDLSHEVIPISSDEIGQLERSVDAMRRGLIEHIERLEAKHGELVHAYRTLERKVEDLRRLREAGEKLSSSLDGAEIQELIVDLFCRHFELDRAALLTFNPESYVLRSVARRGIVERPDAAMALRLTEGIRRFLLSVDHLRIRPGFDLSDLREGTRRTVEQLLEAYAPSVLLPLRVEHDLVGVMALGERPGGRDYDREDLEFCVTMASEGALALHNARLFRLATTDGLTELYVRRYFEQRLREEISRSRRYAKPLTFLMCDIDHFKRINDTYGHACGDRVLEDVGLLLRQSCRDIDVAGRLGGEEFALILPETDAPGGRIFAERLRRLVEDHRVPKPVEGVVELAVTISIGVATWTEASGESPDELVERADQALYRAKDRGRNRVEIADDVVVRHE